MAGAVVLRDNQRRAVHSDDDVRETPGSVVGAVSFGTAPLPFLAVYAALFILHGWLRPVHPPDITSSQTGELIAGIIAAAVFVLLSLTLWLFLNGRRRWPFVLGQLVVLGTSIYFLFSDTAGGTIVSLLVLLATLIALVLAFAPSAWEHVDQRSPKFVERVYLWRPAGSTPSAPAGDQSVLPGSSDPTVVESSSLRRRRTTF